MSREPAIMEPPAGLIQAASTFLGVVDTAFATDPINATERLSLAIQAVIQALDHAAGLTPAQAMAGLAAATGWAISDFSGATQQTLMQQMVHDAMHHAGVCRAQTGGQTHGQVGHA